jgi:hypothetical protein
MILRPLVETPAPDTFSGQIRGVKRGKSLQIYSNWPTLGADTYVLGPGEIAPTNSWPARPSPHVIRILPNDQAEFEDFYSQAEFEDFYSAPRASVAIIKYNINTEQQNDR